MIRWWVGLWDRKEGAYSMALIRVLLSVVVLYDLLAVAYHGLIFLLWAPKEMGGAHDITARLLREPPEPGWETLYIEWLGDLVFYLKGPWVYQLFGTSEAVVMGLYLTVLLSVMAFGLGIATRYSGILFLVSYAQTAIINDQADRGIDRMVRLIVLVLIFSKCGEAFSIDALRKTGRWLGDGRLIPSWPRYVIILQLVVMYWCAGVEKFAITWFPWGGYSALYIILQDPIFATVDYSFLGSVWLYPFTQIGTAVSHMWEWTYPVILLAYYYRDTPDRPGRLRHFFLKWDVRLWYVAVGVIFHVVLQITLHLGVFPMAMLALYPAFFHPTELTHLVARIRKSSGGAGDQYRIQP